jgi:polyhydroxybutyrate depolymerase
MWLLHARRGRLLRSNVLRFSTSFLVAAAVASCGVGLRPEARPQKSIAPAASVAPTAAVTSSSLPVGSPSPSSTVTVVVTTAAPTTTTTTTTVRVPMKESILSIDSGGTTREALVHVPEHVAGAELAMLVAIHGSGFDGPRFPDYTQLTPIADREGFIIVYPLGDSVRITGYPELFRSWNAGRCCPYANDYGVDDVGFLDLLLNELTATTPVDPDRITMVGHSNGAMMAQRYACERTDRLAAVVSISGSMTANRCEPSRPLPMLEVHATADVEVPYNAGGLPSAREAVDRWRFMNRCGDVSIDETIDSPITQITRRRWICEGTADVELITMQGGDHDWVHPPAFDTETEVWAFASRYRR